MSGLGNFSPEAYEKMLTAYAAQSLKTGEAEEAGIKVGQETLPVETSLVRSEWLDTTGLWQYPSGRGDYLDQKQSQNDLLAALRDEAGNIEFQDAEEDLGELSDEEIERVIEEILAESEDGELTDSEDDEEISDEEIDSLIDSILGESDEDDDNEEPSDSDDEPYELDVDDISNRISELRAELEELTDSLQEPDEDFEPDNEEDPEPTEEELSE